jgi:hypothetical protein
MAKSDDKYRRIGRNFGVGSAKILAVSPGGRPEIGVFVLVSQINSQFGKFDKFCQYLAYFYK